MKIKRIITDGFETVFESTMVSLELNGVIFDIQCTGEFDDILYIRKHNSENDTINIKCGLSNCIEVR